MFTPKKSEVRKRKEKSGICRQLKNFSKNKHNLVGPGCLPPPFPRATRHFYMQNYDYVCLLYCEPTNAGEADTVLHNKATVWFVWGFLVMRRINLLVCGSMSDKKFGIRYIYVQGPAVETAPVSAGECACH